TMIIYSALTEESLGKLFIAGFIPGIVVMALFILYSVVSCSRTGAYTKIQPYSWKERFGAFKTAIWGLLAPAIILFGIYSGLFTVLEAGAVVALYAFVMALARRKITLRQLPEVLRQSAASGGMILAIFFGALVMGLFITLLQVPNTVVQAISAMNIPGWAVIWLLMLIYIILGMFLEVISVMLITLPIVYPLIISLGFDGIWFAVLVTLNMEMALITPPVGMNLYVVKGISGASISDVVRGMIPFFAIMLVGMLIVYFFPQLSTWLPNLVVR
ncbi:MAG: TRAP transporter large permease, partial [Chloroflexi bacterium]|nr:TRAP transporter large permease [Chloroflexota bacterium]